MTPSGIEPATFRNVDLSLFRYHGYASGKLSKLEWMASEGTPPFTMVYEGVQKCGNIATVI